MFLRESPNTKRFYINCCFFLLEQRDGKKKKKTHSEYP